ncbi:MAG: dihydropteroate synthase-like protein [Candidatus Bathyarchaeota archaeon]|nr:MAG: dihydropteroate synthase-like protein [Candidatus Bathyarchaeota archaeon]
MKVLLITGLLAENTVQHYAQENRVKTKVLALKVPVAALLIPERIAKALENLKGHDFDVILIPGLTRGIASVIADTTGIPTFKGPRYAADLPTVLNALGQVKLSTVSPACDILREELQRKALQELEVVEKDRDALLKKKGNMLIRELAIGKDFPMRVMAEIVDAPLMSNSEIQRLAKDYVKVGAEIIDVGMVAGETKPSDAKRAVKAVKSVVNVPVSIDSLDPNEIREAVSAGADIILSADAGNINKIAPFASDTAVVVIPTNQREGYFPKKAEERVSFLEDLIEKAKKLGITKLIGDLILDPSNVVESLIAFGEFANRNPNVPLFVGVSNVTELIDADSIGVNALLARLSSEVGASIMLATEKSSKAKGSVREEVIASKMMFLAKKRGSVPKDLGLDLLVLKDKRVREEPYDKEVEANSQVITATEKFEPAILDTAGVFRITLDRNEGTIVALHFATLQADKPSNIVKGRTAERVYTEIVERGLVTRLDHASYLGSELAKAEIALKTGKEYIQDNPLFKKSYY